MFASASQYVHVTGHSPRHRMNCEMNLDAALGQEVG